MPRTRKNLASFVSATRRAARHHSAPRWDQYELDRQISDLGTILAAQVVEFDKARDLAWINITGVTQRGPASGCAKRGRDELS